MQRYVPISSKGTMTGTRVHSRTVGARSHVCGSRRGTVVVKAGLFDFLFGGPRAKSSPRATELVDELLDIAVRTKGGNRGGSETVAQVEELINELEEYRGASTLRSPLFWGDYKVVYASKQVALGGPFRTGLGQVIFSDQYAGNQLAKPNRYTNRLLFKTLGLVEGSVTQFAEFTPTGPNSFDLAFFSEEFNVIGKQVKDCDPESNANRRTIEIVYQDDRVQIRRGIVPGRGGAPTLFVLERQGVKQEQRQASPASQAEGQGTFKLGRKPKAGLATMAERNLRTGTPERTEKVQVPGMKSARAEERAAEAAARQQAKEEAAAVRQAEIEAREAEREAQRKQREEIQEMMQQLQSQAKEAQAEAKRAQDSLRRVQRQNQGVLRNAEEERTRLERLEEELTQVRSDLSAAVDEEKEATVIVRRLNKELKEAEKALR